MKKKKTAGPLALPSPSAEGGETRQSNIELLRIVAMVLIVAHHFAFHSGFSFSSGSVTLNRLWIQLIQMGGKAGVNIYVLIAGYFLVEAERTSAEKTAKLWLRIVTYSLGLYGVFLLREKEPPLAGELMYHALPITYNRYWFAGTYFVLYMASPYLNRLLRNLTKTEYQQMLAGMAILWCLVPTLSTGSWQYSDLVWFLFLYALAGYVRLHVEEEKIDGKTCRRYALLFAGLAFLAVMVFDILGTVNPVYAQYATFFYGMNKLHILLISLFLFLSFLRLKLRPNRWINTAASGTFGVYLLHDHPDARNYLWLELFQNGKFAHSGWLIPYSAAVILGVYTLCTCIELTRQYLLERYYMPGLGRKVRYWAECIRQYLLTNLFGGF